MGNLMAANSGKLWLNFLQFTTLFAAYVQKQMSKNCAKLKLVQVPSAVDANTALSREATDATNNIPKLVVTSNKLLTKSCKNNHHKLQNIRNGCQHGQGC